MKYKITIEREIVEDREPDLGYLKYEYNDPRLGDDERERYREADRKRLEDFGREWWMVGVRARARIEWPTEGRGYVCVPQTLHTPGVWGIESDQREEIARAYSGERELMIGMLKAMGLAIGELGV